MWEYLIGAIAEPVRSLREVAEKRLWKEGLLLVAVLALLNAGVTLASNNFLGTGAGAQEAEIARILSIIYNPAVLYRPVVLLPVMLATSVLSWLISGLAFFGFSRLFKGQGTLTGMLAGLAFAKTPYLFSTPLSALALLLGRVTGPLLGGVAGFVAAIWILALSVLAIRESQRLGTGQAIAVPLITIAAFFVLIIAIAAIAAIIAAIIAIAGGSVAR